MLTDEFLADIMARYRGEDGINRIEYIGFSDQNTTIDSSTTSLSNEIGDRSSVSYSRTSNELTISGTRTTSQVQDTSNGDTIESLGHFGQESSGNLKTVFDVSSVDHTKNFDLSIQLTINSSN